MDADPLRGALQAAADDAVARRARRDVATALTTGFQRVGQSLRVSGHLFGPQRVEGTSPFGNGDDRLVALGYLSETAAALISGAVDLVEHGNLYAASALNRLASWSKWSTSHGPSPTTKRKHRVGSAQHVKNGSSAGSPVTYASARKAVSAARTTASTVRSVVTPHRKAYERS